MPTGAAIVSMSTSCHGGGSDGGNGLAMRGRAMSPLNLRGKLHAGGCFLGTISALAMNNLNFRGKFHEMGCFVGASSGCGGSLRVSYGVSSGLDIKPLILRGRIHESDCLVGKAGPT